MWMWVLAAESSNVLNAGVRQVQWKASLRNRCRVGVDVGPGGGSVFLLNRMSKSVREEGIEAVASCCSNAWHLNHIQTTFRANAMEGFRTGDGKCTQGNDEEFPAAAKSAGALSSKDEASSCPSHFSTSSHASDHGWCIFMR